MLPRLYRVIISPQVASELAVKPGTPGSGVPHLPWVEHKMPHLATLRRVQGELAADPGEEEAVALALELSTWVVLDDLKARRYARRVNLRLVGTLGVLLRIHRFGLASRSLEAEIKALEERGMRLSAELIRGACMLEGGEVS